MKLALIYNPLDNKLQEQSYSQTYRQMFLAIIEKFGQVQHITQSCSAKDIDADVIIFYDVHSSHHIEVDGLANHKSIKYEYLDDPFQKEFTGKYIGGCTVHKLGAEQRIKRIFSRGVSYIVCPYTDTYYSHLAPYIGKQADDMLVWFPVAPNASLFKYGNIALKERIKKVLANGALHDGGSGIYNFRKWSYSQNYITHIPHKMYNKATPIGVDYYNLLSCFAGALAITDFQVVPKYLEIPLAGSVCFCNMHEDYKWMGFRDYENCIVVNKNNFENKIKDFLAHPTDYQHIASSGRDLIKNNWTSTHFAQFIYDHAKMRCKNS